MVTSQQQTTCPVFDLFFFPPLLLRRALVLFHAKLDLLNLQSEIQMSDFTTTKTV